MKEYNEPRHGMTTGHRTSLQTQASLLSRLRDLDDHESWRTFFNRYWRLIYNVARRTGLDENYAQDVVQETVVAVARKLPGFRYDPKRGSFKQWLLRITHRRIADHLRKLYRQPMRVDIDPALLDENEVYAAAVSGPAEERLEQAWEEEWERALFDAAVESVRKEVNPKHFQVFDYCALRGWPVSKVASTLGLNAAQVYLAKHRVLQAVKRTVRRMNVEG
jgi:RNA polymerase sigma factor (sigma-70 family)